MIVRIHIIKIIRIQIVFLVTTSITTSRFSSPVFTNLVEFFKVHTIQILAIVIIIQEIIVVLPMRQNIRYKVIIYKKRKKYIKASPLNWFSSTLPMQEPLSTFFSNYSSGEHSWDKYQQAFQTQINRKSNLCFALSSEKAVLWAFLPFSHSFSECSILRITISGYY